MLEQFFTRDKANEGIKIPLFYPNGEVSGYSLRIRGVDSDHFRQAERESVRKAVKLRQQHEGEDALSDKEVEEAFEEERLRLVSQLVISWDLPEEFTEENLLNLLRNAPNLADAINQRAADRKHFFTKESDSSKNTPDGNTGSKNLLEDQNKA